MDLQIALLRAILAGEQPATPQNLVAAYNKDVVAARAVAAQQKALDSTLEALESERERLDELVRRQQRRNRDLQDTLECETPSLDTKSVPNIEKVRPHISTLSRRYLAPLSLGAPDAIEKVLWRLVEVGSRGEQLIVPADLPIVKFLSEEGLIESEPAYAGQLRIRLI